MPFDTTNFDYTKVTPVYDRDNPPKRMSEAIRMAVADVEAQDAAGVEYDYFDCMRCTAGAVCRRIGVKWTESGWSNVKGWGAPYLLSQHLEPVGLIHQRRTLTCGGREDSPSRQPIKP